MVLGICQSLLCRQVSRRLVHSSHAIQNRANEENGQDIAQSSAISDELVQGQRQVVLNDDEEEEEEEVDINLVNRQCIELIVRCESE